MFINGAYRRQHLKGEQNKILEKNWMRTAMLPNYLFYLIYKSQCVCSYISGIEIQTLDPSQWNLAWGYSSMGEGL